MIVLTYGYYHLHPSQPPSSLPPPPARALPPLLLPPHTLLAKTTGPAAEVDAKAKVQADAVERPPVVTVFKIALKVLTECLWKDKVIFLTIRYV